MIVADKPAGVLGEIHPDVASALDIEGRVAVCVVGLATIALGKAGDFVFRDDNRNGIQDPGEPAVPNVTVTLQTPGGGPVNDADGAGVAGGPLRRVR